MRNLKRALSLALASVMLMGMMVVGTSASYADVTSKQNKEAIEVAQAVGVMIGDDKGNFNPDAKVTRVEMAVVMSNLLNLKVNDFKNTKTGFTDVPAWAEAYVAACKADGIIAGYSATTFGANDTVTAAQAGLMVLKALGYFQYAADFGDDWKLSAVKQASKIDLYDEIDAGSDTALTRNDVAQLVLNALEATMVEPDGNGGTTIKGEGFEITTGNTQYTEVTKKADEKWDSIDSDKDINGKSFVQLGEQLFGTDLKKDDDKKTDDFGRPATKWTYKGTEVGTYSDKADAVYTNKVTKAALYDLVGKDTVDDIKKAASTKAKLNVIVDGTPTVEDSKDADTIALYFDKKNTQSIGDNGVPKSNTAITGNGTSTEVYIDDDNNAVKIVVINTYLVKASSDYNTKRETVSVSVVGNYTKNPIVSSISSDDFAVENVKEDDYLLITYSKGVNKVESVTPATVVTGNVSTYGDSNVTIAGTKYKYAFTADTSDSHGKKVSYDIGEDAKVVTDGTYILYVDEATVAADKYVYISEIATDGKFDNDKDYIGKAYFLDGTQKTIVIKDKYNTNATPSAEADTKNLLEAEGKGAGWYAYSVNSSDKYTLTQLSAGDSENNTGSVASTTENGYKLTENGKVNVGAGQSGAVKANSATVFVVVDDDDNVTSYTGVSNVPTIKVKGGTAITAKYVMAKTAGYAKYVFIDAGDAAIDGATKGSSDFIYLLKWDSTGKDADKNDYYVYKALVNGEEKKISLNENFNAKGEGNCAIDTLYTDVKYDENGYVDSMNVADSGDDYVVVSGSAKIALSDASVNYADDVLTIGGKDFVVAKNCKIYLIAADSNVKEDAGSKYETTLDMSANSLYTTLKDYNGHIDGSYYAQVDDDSDTLTTLYVFVSNTNA